MLPFICSTFWWTCELDEKKKFSKRKIPRQNGSLYDSKIYLPRPLRPTNRKSLNLATWFFITAVQFRSSAHQFSSLPAFIVTEVPSPTSANATTLNGTGSVLFDRQWFGSAEHRIYGLPVRTVMKYIKNSILSCSLSFFYFDELFIISEEGKHCHMCVRLECFVSLLLSFVWSEAISATENTLYNP